MNQLDVDESVAAVLVEEGFTQWMKSPMCP